MGFHPNDKRSQVIRSKTHTTFFIFLLDKVKYWFYTVCSWKRKYSVFDFCAETNEGILEEDFEQQSAEELYENWISLCDVRRIYANINSFLLYN